MKTLWSLDFPPTEHLTVNCGDIVYISACGGFVVRIEGIVKLPNALQVIVSPCLARTVAKKTSESYREILVGQGMAELEAMLHTAELSRRVEDIVNEVEGAYSESICNSVQKASRGMCAIPDPCGHCR